MVMQRFADHVIAVSNKYVGGISNLQLQKVMYFALGEYIKDCGIDELVREIYTEPFEAWPYGPVIRTEYFRNRLYGRYNIQREALPQADYQVFNAYIQDNVLKNITELVEESHDHPTWFNNREAILQHHVVVYDLEDIANDFQYQ